MRNKVIVFLILCIAMIFSGCFSPWAGGEQGTLNISIGGGQARSTGQSFLENLNTDYFLHIITITGPGQKQEARFMGSKSASFTVATGRWHIDVKAYDLSDHPDIDINIEITDNELPLVAEGSDDVNVKAGNNTKEIRMRKPIDTEENKDRTYLISVEVITGQNGWLANYNAKGNLNYGYVELICNRDEVEIYKYDSFLSSNLNKRSELFEVKGSDTVTIKAKPNKGAGNFEFLKWVRVGNEGLDQTWTVINDEALKINGSLAKSTEHAIKVSDIAGETGTLRLIAVFDGDGSAAAPKNITHDGKGEGGLKSMDMLKHYALMTDLTLNDWTPIGTSDAPFAGTFNGMGHKITFSGIMKEQIFDIETPTVIGTGSANGNTQISGVASSVKIECAGLFAFIYKGTVKNIALDGLITVKNYEVSSSNIGAVAGQLHEGIIENVVSSVYINTGNGTIVIYAGGIAGWIDSSSVIRNCASIAQIGDYYNSKISYGGGIVGSIGGLDGEGEISNCWASGAIYANSCAGGIAGSISAGSIKNCVAVNSNISSDKVKGRIVGEVISSPTLMNNYADVSGFETSTDIQNDGGTVNSNDYKNVIRWYDSYWSSPWAISNGSGTPEASETTPWIWNVPGYTANSPFLKLWFNISY